MRIVFEPINQSNVNERYLSLNEFNVVEKVVPSYYHCFDNLKIKWLDTFSDKSRYFLDIYDVEFNRCYSSQESSYQFHDLKHNGVIRVFELFVNFNIDFDFKLFDEQFIDIWKNDINIEIIKPLITTISNDRKSPYIAFNSLATSYFAKMFNILKNNLMCEKRDNKIIFAFLLNDEREKETDILLNLFIDAIYEIVKSIGFRLEYNIPVTNYQIKVNMKDWYKKQRKNNKYKKKNISITI